MRLAYKLKAVFCSLAFLNFGHPFVVTACTHSNMSLKSGGLQHPPLSTPLLWKPILEKQSPVVAMAWITITIAGNNPQISLDIQTVLLECKASL